MANYREEDHGLAYYITLTVIWLVFFVGWVMNIIAIWNTMDNPVTAKFILRCIGVFVGPVGSILGYLS
jgi:hypothetical protein